MRYVRRAASSGDRCPSPVWFMCRYSGLASRHRLSASTSAATATAAGVPVDPASEVLWVGGGSLLAVRHQDLGSTGDGYPTLPMSPAAVSSSVCPGACRVRGLEVPAVGAARFRAPRITDRLGKETYEIRVGLIRSPCRSHRLRIVREPASSVLTHVVLPVGGLEHAAAADGSVDVPMGRAPHDGRIPSDAE